MASKKRLPDSEPGKPYTTADGVVHQRKPRFRRLLRAASTSNLQGRFLRELAKGGLTATEIARRLQLSENTIYMWRQKFSGFKEGMDRLLAERDEIAAKLRVPSVEDKLFEKAVGGDVKAAIPYLEARFPEVYGKKEEVRHSGVVITVTGDELARIYREARSEFLQAGGEPLGLADGSGNGERPTAGSRDDEVPAVASPPPGAAGNRKQR